MASSTRLFVLLLLLLLHASLFFLPSPILCDDSEDLDQEEKDLLKELNRYREDHNLDRLKDRDAANCLADKIAAQFQISEPCLLLTPATFVTAIPGTGTQIPDYTRLLLDCDLTVDHTKDGLILPACTGLLQSDVTSVAANFTQTHFSHYLADSDYTGVGIGSEGSWFVVILTTRKEGGDFSGGWRPDWVVGYWPLAVISCFMIVMLA